MSNSKKKGNRKKGEDKDKILILVDSNSIAHMVKHTMKGAKGREKESAIIYGFMVQILSIANNFNTNRFIFAWDSRKSKRKEIDPLYKKRTINYTEEDEEAFQQFAEIRTQVLPKLGFKNIFIQAGFEADDIVAQVANQLWSKKIAIISRDSDLYQCLRQDNFMWHPTKKKRFTMKNFIEEYKMSPFQWAEVKAIAGDTSDNITGIDQIGIGRACQLIRGEIKNDSKFWHRIREKDNFSIITKNFKLVNLPFPGTLPLEITNKEEFYRADFLDVCKEYDFKAFLTATQTKGWSERFNMK